MIIYNGKLARRKQSSIVYEEFATLARLNKGPLALLAIPDFHEGLHGGIDTGYLHIVDRLYNESLVRPFIKISHCYGIQCHIDTEYVYPSSETRTESLSLADGIIERPPVLADDTATAVHNRTRL